MLDPTEEWKVTVGSTAFGAATAVAYNIGRWLWESVEKLSE